MLSACELLHVFFALWSLHLNDGPDLVRICFDAFFEAKQQMTFPLVIPNMHFSRLSLILALRIFAKVFAGLEI
jgi:hypothetical protein